MSSAARLAALAALAADPARAAMLQALMDGRALTAGELGQAGGVSPSTASSHLKQLVEGGMLRVLAQGRHRYYRLAGEPVARVLETLMAAASELAPGSILAIATGPKQAALRHARTCYDHFAGRLGVALADGLASGGFIELGDDAAMLTDSGLAMLPTVGIDVSVLVARRSVGSGRVLCRPCLDWSERRPHLAGLLGKTLCAHSFAQGWVRRLPGTRAVTVTPIGARIFRQAFGASLERAPH